MDLSYQRVALHLDSINLLTGMDYSVLKLTLFPTIQHWSSVFSIIYSEPLLKDTPEMWTHPSLITTHDQVILHINMY